MANLGRLFKNPDLIKSIDCRGVCHIVAVPFTLKVSEGKKTNYKNLNISPRKKNIIFKKKSSKKKPESFKIL